MLQATSTNFEAANDSGATREVPALREWAATCRDVEHGRQLLLIRKGGISEPEFTVEGHRFLLLPTLFHQAQGSPPPANKVEIRVLCELVATAEVPSSFDLTPFQPFHGYDAAQLATRLAYKPEKPLTLLALRPFRLDRPFTLNLNTIRPACRSWQAISAPGDLRASPIAARASLEQLTELLSPLESFHAV